MKRNQVKTKKLNSALCSLFDDPTLTITVDANIIIPPDRSNIIKNLKPLPFSFCRDSWLELILGAFPGMAIHEAVLAELEGEDIRSYVRQQLDKVPPRIRLLSDATLSAPERMYRECIEKAIAYHTSYDPELDNRDDRGEVKSLAHIATKQYLYFCSHDHKALQLIEEAEQLETQLDALETLRPYEMIYYLVIHEIGDLSKLRTFYKYLYYASASDKAVNPSWEQFLVLMNDLYKHYCPSLNEFPSLLTFPN